MRDVPGSLPRGWRVACEHGSGAANPIARIRPVCHVALGWWSPVAKIIPYIFRILGRWATRSNQVATCPITLIDLEPDRSLR